MLFRAVTFAAIAFVIVLVADILSSAAAQEQAHGANYLFMHGVFHFAVLALSSCGAAVALWALRDRLPSWSAILLVGCVYGLVTVLAGPGALLLAGKAGVVSWLLLGSLGFCLGAALSGKPWRRPSL